jgi:FAD/FMN-containing dehydrogenase
MSSLADLRARHRGPVIAPDDSGYEAARGTFNGMLDRKPELVTRALDVDDVAAAVGYALEAGLPVAVRGGGHGVAGHCVCDGSLVVDLRLMRDVSVDPKERTVTCGGGALWEDVDPACQRHGLAMPGGTFGDTGVAGLTLGGGIGHLTPALGLTLDNLLRVKLVTGNGEIITAREEDRPELFWALRGGGGNFGVVTEFTFRLHPVGLLYGGAVVFPLQDAPAVLRAWRDLMTDAPDSFQSFAQVFRDGGTGDGGVHLSIAQLDGAEAGREVVERLTGDLTPQRIEIRTMYYPEIQEIYARLPFGLRNYWSGRFLRELPDEVLSLTAEKFAADGANGAVLFESLHGAPQRVPADATAFAGRQARWDATFINVWVDPKEDDRQIEAARSYSKALAPWAVGGGYLNYASEAASQGLESEYGAEKLARLRAIKREYDPANVFRFNHNIAPAES